MESIPHFMDSILKKYGVHPPFHGKIMESIPHSMDSIWNFWNPPPLPWIPNTHNNGHEWQWPWTTMMTNHDEQSAPRTNTTPMTSMRLCRRPPPWTVMRVLPTNSFPQWSYDGTWGGQDGDGDGYEGELEPWFEDRLGWRCRVMICWGCEAGFFSFLFSHPKCWWEIYALSFFLSFLPCAVLALMLSISLMPSFALLLLWWWSIAYAAAPYLTQPAWQWQGPTNMIIMVPHQLGTLQHNNHLGSS